MNYVYLNGEKVDKNLVENKFELGKINKDLKTTKEDFELILCRQDDTEMSMIKEAYDISFTTPFKDTYELSFKIPYYIKRQHEQIKNPNVDMIKDGMLVKVNNKYMFKINEYEDDDDEKYVKSIHCYSREINLSKRKLVNFVGTRQLYRDGSETLVNKIKYSFDDINYVTYTNSFIMEEGKNLFIKVYDHNDTEINTYKWNSKDKLHELEGIDVTYKVTDSINFKIEVSIKIIAETGDGILNILEDETSWKIGYIDPEVREDRSKGQNHRKYRVFNVSEQDWLSFLREDIQKSFDCVLEFDSLNKVINIYHIDNITEDKGLYISKQNYAKKISRQVKDDDLITRLNIYGKDNLDITDINPTGMPYIEDFSYYRTLKYMPQDLLDALDKYDKLVEEKTPIFYNLLQNRHTLNSRIAKLENDLVDLKVQYEIAQDNIDNVIQFNEKNKDEPTTKVNDGTFDISEELKVNLSDFDKPLDLTELNNKRDKIKSQMESKQQEIENVVLEITQNENNIRQLGESLKKSNNFTTSQLNILDDFIKEGTWKNESYYDSKDLLSAGKNALDKLSQPIIELDLNIVDFLNLVECQHDWKKLKLGDFIHVYSDKMDIEYKVRIINITHEIDSNSLNITISNKEDVDNTADYLADLMKNVNDVASTVDMFKPIWDLSERNTDLVSQIMSNALDSAKNRILSARNQNIRIDERGIHMKDMFSDDEQLRIVNNCLAFTRDNWRTVSTAVSPMGVVAEQIYGKIVGSNKLIITNMNDEGESSFLVDKNHMKAINMDLSLEGNNNKNRIFLNPKIGIKLQKRDGLGYPWEDVIYLDINDGSVWAKSFHVINTNSVLDDKGLRIDNGCIWINNENGDDIFNVNTDGEVDANGRFRVFRYDNSKNKIWLADLYKDESNGGKLLLNDWDGNINAFLGSAPDYTYTGGFLKLYNGDTTKERIEIGTQSLNDMGIIKIKNNESKKIVELTGSDTGGTIRLNNKLEQTKLFMSSQDEGLNQGIIKLYGEDNHVKLMLKAKSSTDNMSGIVSGDRKTGGLIQFNSYDNTSKYFITVNNENNFGMYSEKGDAFEINKSANRCTVYHNSNRHIKLSDTDIVMGFNIIQGEGTDYHNKAIIVNNNQIVIKFDDNNYITLDANGVTVKGSQINLN